MKIHGSPSLASLRPPLERPLRRLRAYSEMSEITSSDERLTILYLTVYRRTLWLSWSSKVVEKRWNKDWKCSLSFKDKKEPKNIREKLSFFERENLTQFKRSIRNVANWWLRKGTVVFNQNKMAFALHKLWRKSINGVEIFLRLVAKNLTPRSRCRKFYKGACITFINHTSHTKIISSPQEANSWS